MTQKSASSTFDVMAESAEQAVPCADLPLEQRIEALLMVADRPMTDARIAEVLSVQDPKGTKVREAVDALNARYAADGRTFRIERVAGGNQVMTLPAFGPWMLAK